MISKNTLLKLKEKHKNNMSAISRELNVCKTTVSNYYKKYGITPNKKGFNKKYYANDSFFSNWSEDMAYCLGFLAADGHIWENRPFFTIGISKKDKCILEFIVSCISPDTQIRESNDKVQICIHSEQIWKDLNKLGVKHDKTHNLRLPNIPKKYFKDFIRGYFDGDGSIWMAKFRKDSKDYYYSNIVSCSSKFLKDIKDRLGFGCFRQTHKNCYELKFSQRNSLKLFHFMYDKKHSFHLNRKYEKFLKIDIRYNFWTDKEDGWLKNNLDSDKKTLVKGLPKRSWESIKVRRNKWKQQK